MTKWVTKKLGEICWPSPDKYNPLIQKEFKDCIEMENIEQNSGSINGMSDISKLLSIKNKFEKGDVLYGKLRPYLRKYWLAQFNGVCSTEIWVLKHDDSVNSKYLFYLFQTEQINKIANLSSGTKMPRADWSLMQNKYISIPESIAEQRRIAGILSSADGAIAASEALVEKYRNIKRGLLTTLLQPKEGWKKVKLGECCEVNPKTDLSALHSNDEIAFLKMEDVSNDGKITNCNYLKYCFLAKKGFTTFQNEDVIFAKITPCMENGKGALVRNIKSVVGMGSTEFHVLRAKENISIDFIYQISISKHFRLEAEMQMTGSAGQQRVPTAFLEEYEISVPYKNGQPDLAEQRRIAEILSSVDAKIAAEEKVVEKYKGVKKGLMEELLKDNYR